jgi:NADH-quinone oxidoreductase subunit L
VASVTAFLTAIYMFRLVFLAFHGTHGPKDPGLHADVTAGPKGHGLHLHDAPPAMALALIVLAIGSVGVGYLGIPHALGGSNWLETFLAPSLHVTLSEGVEAHPSESLELGLMAVSTAVAVGGIALAALLFLYRREIAAALAARFAGVHQLLLNKYYVDELYDRAIVEPVHEASEDVLWQAVDVRVIDGVVNGAGGAVSGMGGVLRRLQTGSIRAYGASLLFGAVVILTYWLW